MKILITALFIMLTSAITLAGRTANGVADDGERKRAILSLRQRITNWIDSQYSRARIGSAELFLLPEPVPLSFTDRFSIGAPKKGYAFMPIPACVIGEIPRDEPNKIKLEVAPVSGVQREQKLGIVTLTASVQFLGGVEYLVHYESLDDYSGSIRYTWLPLEKSLYKSLREQAGTLFLEPCKGTERKEFLESFDKAEI